MNTQAAEMLQGASLDFLRRHSPFDRMEAEALGFVAERLVLTFHARDSVILSPEMGQVRHLHIVQRGYRSSLKLNAYPSLQLGEEKNCE